MSGSKNQPKGGAKGGAPKGAAARGGGVPKSGGGRGAGPPIKGNKAEARAERAKSAEATLTAIETVLVDVDRESPRDVLRHPAGLNDTLVDMIRVQTH